MSLFLSLKNEKKQEPKKINIQDLIKNSKALSEELPLDETLTEIKDAKIDSEVLKNEKLTFDSSEVSLNDLLKKKIKGLSKESQEDLIAGDTSETREAPLVSSLIPSQTEIFSEEELFFDSVSDDSSLETTPFDEDLFDKIYQKEKEINESEVPSTDKTKGFFEAYSLVDLKSVVPELELEFYITSIPNYDGKLPNILVKTEEGKYVIKTSEDILPSDEFRLTKQEILKDWEYLFTNGFSELLD